MKLINRIYANIKIHENLSAFFLRINIICVLIFYWLVQIRNNYSLMLSAFPKLPINHWHHQQVKQGRGH